MTDRDAGLADGETGMRPGRTGRWDSLKAKNFATPKLIRSSERVVKTRSQKLWIRRSRSTSSSVREYQESGDQTEEEHEDRQSEQPAAGIVETGVVAHITSLRTGHPEGRFACLSPLADAAAMASSSGRCEPTRTCSDRPPTRLRRRPRFPLTL